MNDLQECAERLQKKYGRNVFVEATGYASKSGSDLTYRIHVTGCDETGAANCNVNCCDSLQEAESKIDLAMQENTVESRAAKLNAQAAELQAQAAKLLEQSQIK